MTDQRKMIRKMRTATNEATFTNVMSEDAPRMKESRTRAKSVGGSSPNGPPQTLPGYASGTPRKSVSGTPHGALLMHGITSGDASPRVSCDSRGSPELIPEDKTDVHGPTMRHLVKLVQRLLSEYQFVCASRLLEHMSKEVLLNQILDTPIPGAWKLTSNMLDLANSERDKYNIFINTFVQNITELVGSDFDKSDNGEVELGSNLLDKLEKRDGGRTTRKTKGKSIRKDDAPPKDGKGTLSSALGLDSGTLGEETDYKPDSNGDQVQKRRSEALHTGRASLLSPTEVPKFRSRHSVGGGSFAATEALHKELTGLAPRVSLTHALGLNMPPSMLDGAHENSVSHRSSINSEASMVEDDASEFGGSICSSRSPAQGAAPVSAESTSPHDANNLSRTPSINSKMDSHFRGSAASAASLGGNLANIIGSVEKPDDRNAATELELEVNDPLPSNEASHSTRDRFEDMCPACGNKYMPDARFCRKCGRKRELATLPRDKTELSKDLQGLLSWRLQEGLFRHSPEDVSEGCRIDKDGTKRRWSLDDAIRWKRSSTVNFPLKTSSSLPPERSAKPTAMKETYSEMIAASIYTGQATQRSDSGADFGQRRSDSPSEIKVTEPAEVGFKETRFKILVPTKDDQRESESDIGSRSGSETEAAEIIVRPTGSILACAAAIHAKGSQKIKRAKSMGGLPDMFKENLEEDRAAYLSIPSHMFIVHPNSMFRMSWDVTSLFIILFEAIILPLGLCFDIYPPDFVMWISTVFFIPDLILNMFTGFYHNGLLILRQKIILRRYLMGWFSVDFLSTVPWEAFFNSQQGQAGIILKFAKISKLMRVLRLLRVLKLKALIQRVEDMCSSYVVLVALSIMKIVAFYMLVCHWTACMWGWLGDDDYRDTPYNRAECEPDGPCEHGIGIRDSPWRRRYGVKGEPPMQHYLVALQFSTGLLTGAELNLMPGYWMERVFITGMMIVSFLVCSMIISQIVVVMDKINQDNSEYLEHSRIIRDFMVSRGMPIKLQTKVKRYLEYQFKSRKVVHQNHDILFKLSPYLRMEIQEHMNKAILEHHPFFKGMDHSVLSQVCSLAQSVLYAPGDVVMRKGQIESLICFIVRGQLQIVEARKGVSIYIRAPAWTGDRGLFVATIRLHTVTCSMHSELLTICQQDLIDLVKSIPAAEEYIKEYCKRVIKNDPSTIFCHFCRGSRHDMDTCRELTEALRPGQQAGFTDEKTDEAWYQRAKKNFASGKAGPPSRKGTRDSRVLNAPASHVTVQGRSVDVRTSQVPTTRNTVLAAAAYAAWEED